MTLRRACLLAALGAAACASVVGIEDTTDEGARLPEAGRRGFDDGVDASSPLEDASDLPDSDAAILAPDDGGDATPPDATACDPTTAFAPPTGGTGTVCDLDRVLPGRTGSAGLDYATGTVGALGGQSVTACIGVNFPMNVVQATLVAAAVPEACNTHCSSGCNTGHTALVFAGNAAAYTTLGRITTSPSFATYDVNVPSALAARQIVVCREAWGGARDDVVVQSIAGFCSP